MSLPQSGTSIQPLGDYTTVGLNQTNSGNPTYADASAGPQAKTPNADPHMMQKKRKKAEILRMLKEGFNGLEPSDPRIMYVQNPLPKRCGTCEYFSMPNMCNVPVDGHIGLTIPVDPIDGCCNKWEADEDDMYEGCMEAVDEAGMQAQTFIFDKDKYSAGDAKKWLKDHGKTADLDSSGPSHRARQKDPGNFKDKSFRTIPITKGIKAVVGKPQEMSEVKSERKYCRSCSKGTDEKSVTCADCGSMEFTTSPMSKFTYNG